MEPIAGFCSPFLIYALILGLNALLPGRWLEGYVTKPNSTEKMRYRLNGLLVLFVVIGLWAGCCYSGLLAWDWLYTHASYGFAGAVTLGLIFSFAIVLTAPPVKTSFWADFYLGRLENPQLWGGRIDAKMWLYLVGAILLALNVLSALAYHRLNTTGSSLHLEFAAALFSYFIIDYFTFEEVHLYTYDLFAERVGFKLGWGCIAFYPYFYAIPFWSKVGLPVEATPIWQLVLYSLVFFAGWGLARGANMQKYFFKKDPTQSFLGIQPETISDGNKTLLVNGFWGLSRHINYLGEILMATGIVLCAGGFSLSLAWLYPLYYVALLFPRQIDDDKRCALKYGELWNEYLKRVPYRIIPYIY